MDCNCNPATPVGGIELANCNTRRGIGCCKATWFQFQELNWPGKKPSCLLKKVAWSLILKHFSEWWCSYIGKGWDIWNGKMKKSSENGNTKFVVSWEWGRSENSVQKTTIFQFSGGLVGKLDWETKLGQMFARNSMETFHRFSQALFPKLHSLKVCLKAFYAK